MGGGICLWSGRKEMNFPRATIKIGLVPFVCGKVKVFPRSRGANLGICFLLRRLLLVHILLYVSGIFNFVSWFPVLRTIFS